MKRNKWHVIIACLALALAASLIFLAQAGKELSLSDVPAAVRATIEKHAEGSEIKGIEMESEKGQQFYEIEILRNGVEMEFMVSTDGVFLGMEKEDEDEDEPQERKISLNQAPAAAQASIKKVIGANQLKEVKEEIEEGTATYEAEYMVGDVEHSVECAATGEVMELEHEIPVNNLPATVLSKLKKDYPNATIQKAEAVQLFFYEVELAKDGKQFEVKVFASGDIEDESEDEDDDDDNDDD